MADNRWVRVLLLDVQQPEHPMYIDIIIDAAATMVWGKIYVGWIGKPSGAPMWPFVYREKDKGSNYGIDFGSGSYDDQTDRLANFSLAAIKIRRGSTVELYTEDCDDKPLNLKYKIKDVVNLLTGENLAE